MNKSELRRKYRQIRKSIQNKKLLDERIAENFFNLFKVENLCIVGGYIPIDGEVNSLLIMEALLERKKIISIPKINGDLLEFTRLDTKLRLDEKHRFFHSESEEVMIPDLVLTPLVAFNSECFRVGFGGGFYDRTILQFKKKDVIFVGLAYSEQFCPMQFQENHDQPLDYIVTQDTGFTFRRSL